MLTAMEPEARGLHLDQCRGFWAAHQRILAQLHETMLVVAEECMLERYPLCKIGSL